MAEPTRSRTGIAFIHNPMRAYHEQGMTSRPAMYDQLVNVLQRQDKPKPKNSRKPRRSHKIKRKHHGESQ